MKRIIFALCLLIAVTSCVSKKKYMVAENGRLAALSRERVLNRNLGQQKDEIAKLKQQITDLMSDTTRLGQAIRDYRKSLQSVRTGKTEYVTEGKNGETGRTGSYHQ